MRTLRRTPGTPALLLATVLASLVTGANLHAQTPATPSDAVRDTSVFAGGCVWCMEPPHDEQEGVRQTISGYAGGDAVAPS